VSAVHFRARIGLAWPGLEAGEVAAEEGGLEPVEEHHELIPRRHLPSQDAVVSRQEWSPAPAPPT
jgi:hypothetical protein